MATLVPVFAKYNDLLGNPARGTVSFQGQAWLSDNPGDRILVGAPVVQTLDGTGSFKVSLPSTDTVSPNNLVYIVTESLNGVVRMYNISLPASLNPTGLDLVTATQVAPGVVNAVPQTTLILGPATGVFTDIVGTYLVPSNATLVRFTAQAGGGGGGSGGIRPSGTFQCGAGGGGGGGWTDIVVSAVALRAAYPSGVPYTVGHGGQGGAAISTPASIGNPGVVGGYTFAGDFVVATPGNLYFPAQGGGGAMSTPAGVLTAANASGIPGSAGIGTSVGGVGGVGGGWLGFSVGVPGITGFTGGGGGGTTLILQFVNGSWQLVTGSFQGGGGGAGGGGGGIKDSPVTAYNGGPSGFAATADPTPIVGSGGVVGGALPTAAGNSVLGAGQTSVQGGGGGGASSITGNAQAGADAPQGSGSGGGGGGSCLNGSTSGAGGNGGSGWLRIAAW